MVQTFQFYLRLIGTRIMHGIMVAPIQPNSTRRSFPAVPEGGTYLNNHHEPDNHFINMPTIVRDPSNPREGGEASGRSLLIVGPSID
jgi:hypothetical protein